MKRRIYFNAFHMNCVVHQSPGLWVRDDDFRLSFTYGSYVTLTNLGPKGLSRLIEQRLSPLYVSVHATEPEVRARLLKNEKAGLIMEQLGLLTAQGLDVHTQVVLCPGWNDGPHLDRTIDDLWGLGEGIRTLSVVPVGLTKYNLGSPVRLLTPSEATAASTSLTLLCKQCLFSPTKTATPSPNPSSTAKRWCCSSATPTAPTTAR